MGFNVVLRGQPHDQAPPGRKYGAWPSRMRYAILSRGV